MEQVKDAAKIIKQANFLKSKGYDVSMVFVNTSLQVSLERNNAREESRSRSGREDVDWSPAEYRGCSRSTSGTMS